MESRTAAHGTGRLAVVLIIPLVMAGAALIAVPALYTLHGAVRGAAMLVTVHALLIGTDLSFLPARVLALATAGVAVAVFLRKRLVEAGRRSD
jgi:hypothetical protein